MVSDVDVEVIQGASNEVLIGTGEQGACAAIPTATGDKVGCTEAREAGATTESNNNCHCSNMRPYL